MANLIEVHPLEGFKLSLKYDDGLEGEFSCADLMKKEEFAPLSDIDLFNKVSIDKLSNDVCWGNKLFLCKNALHKTVELQRLMKVFKIDLEKE